MNWELVEPPSNDDGEDDGPGLCDALSTPRGEVAGRRQTEGLLGGLATEQTTERIISTSSAGAARLPPQETSGDRLDRTDAEEAATGPRNRSAAFGSLLAQRGARAAAAAATLAKTASGAETPR